jgi:hypothetical protein
MNVRSRPYVLVFIGWDCGRAEDCEFIALAPLTSSSDDSSSSELLSGSGT